jgi:hypothetical protein
VGQETAQRTWSFSFHLKVKYACVRQGNQSTIFLLKQMFDQIVAARM